VSQQLSQDELLQILDELGADLISIDDAARRAHLLDTQPARYRCGTCQRFKLGECHRPGQPPARVNPHTVSCGDYVERRESDKALPVTPAGSRMWK